MTGRKNREGAMGQGRVKGLVKKAFRAGKSKSRWMVENIPVYAAGLGRGLGIYYSENTKRLSSYQDKHQGERCFVIGNGPSLTPQDLERLKGEYSFGCNMVYKIFDRTSWRPTYHCVSDMMLSQCKGREFAQYVESPFFTLRSRYREMEDYPEGTVYVYDVNHKHYRVSGHLLWYVVRSKATVVLFMIELAMYMGFQEIYLLGVDCTSSFEKQGHFVENYVSKDLQEKDRERTRDIMRNPQATEEEIRRYHLERDIQRYEKIRKAAQKRRVRIYNATRGGRLEVFPRKSLDVILPVEF